MATPVHPIENRVSSHIHPLGPQHPQLMTESRGRGCPWPCRSHAGTPTRQAYWQDPKSHVAGAVREGPWVSVYGLVHSSLAVGGAELAVSSETGLPCWILPLSVAPLGFPSCDGDDSAPEIFPREAADIQVCKDLRAEKSGGGLWGHLVAKAGETRVVSCPPAGQGQVGAGAADGRQSPEEGQGPGWRRVGEGPRTRAETGQRGQHPGTHWLSALTHPRGLRPKTPQ